MSSYDDSPESSDNEANSATAPTNIPSQHTPNIAMLPPAHLLSMLPYYPHYGYLPTTGSPVQQAPFPVSTPSAPPKKRRRKYNNIHEPITPIPVFTGMSGEPNTTINTEWVKVEEVLGKIQAVGWTIGDFLFHLCKVKDDDGNRVKGRSRTHAAMLSSFLGGKCSYTVSDIIEAWVQSSMGVPKKDSPKRDSMFSIDKHFREIKSARPGITSLAAQLVKEQELDCLFIVGVGVERTM